MSIISPQIVNGGAMVVKPYLQIEGVVAAKPLATLSYDISNAFGFAANQDVFVTDQAFDTNQFDFTTNFFHAFDVPLATNDNWITLRATDRAGNVTTTNFDVILDYTTATNPPVVNLIWPQDGMAVSGTNLTIRGTMSDETGTILAQIVDEDGNTNTVTGLVERNGMFWIENVPLNGASQITLQATDAAGNATTNDFSVTPSDMVLTIDSTPTGDALWEGGGAVIGTVSDPTATVIINGTNAVVDGSYANADGTYNWTAASVQASGQGTATFDAVAYPGQSSMNFRGLAMDASTPSTPPANNSLEVEMQPYVALVSYNGTEAQKYTELDYGNAAYNQTVKNQIAQPAAGTNGQWVLNDRQTNSMYWYEGPGVRADSGHEKFTWGQSPPDAGQEHYDDSWGYTYDGPAQWPDDYTSVLLQSLPHEDQNWGCAGCGWGYMWSAVRHYYANGLQYHWDLAGDTTFDLNLSARTRMKLFTGGKAPVSRRNLFEVDANATEILRPPLDYGTGYPWWDVAGKAVDNASLQVAGKSVGADGKLWLALPDNSDLDLTVVAPGKKHYDAYSTALKYKLHILANGYPLAENHVTLGAHYCVGQYLQFDQVFTPSLSITPQFSPIQWILDGQYVNTNVAPASSDDSGYYTNVPALLKTPSIHAWWISGGLNPSATNVARIAEGLTFANGQYVAVTAKGQFTMFRPQILGHGFIFPGLINLVTYNLPEVGLGMVGGAQHISWRTQVGLDTNFPGMLFHVQLLNGGYFWDVPYPAGIPYTCLGKTSTTSEGTWLDNSVPYEGDGGWAVNTQPLTMTTNAAITFRDGPDLRANFCSFGQLTFDFNNYLCFQPTSAGSIPITLERVEWLMNGRTDLVGTNWTLTSTNMAGPYFNSDDSFPYWPHTFHNSEN